MLFLSTGVLGVFLGAQIAEACLFVPIWKAMEPDSFFQQHKTVGPLIYKFFAPLTIAATVMPLATVATGLTQGALPTTLLWLAGVSTAAFFSTYFLYFKTANQKFAERTLTNEALPGELQLWGNWHWTRIGFEAIAFGCLLLLCLASSGIG